MAKDIYKALEKLLIPTSKGWEITDVMVDEKTEEVEVFVSFTDNEYRDGRKRYSIYDYRPSRRWRHLDLWQFKTYIVSQVPRIKTENGVESVPIPWSESHERITTLFEKKR